MDKRSNNKNNSGNIELNKAPYSLTAEQSVLGGLLLDNGAWDKISDVLSSVDFYVQEHKLIFKAIEKLSNTNKPFDVLTLKEILHQESHLVEIGGDVYLYELANNTPSIANISAYAEIVRERSVLRQLIQLARDIADNAYETKGQSIAELIDSAEQQVLQIGRQSAKSDGPKHIHTLITQTVERIDDLCQRDDPITGVATGFTDFDHLTSGLQPSDLIIVAGRPSMGKTALAVNIAEHAAIKQKLPVLIYSLEMPGDAVAMRMISSLGHLDQHRLRTGSIEDSDWARISSAINVLSDAPIFVDDTPSITPMELRSRTRRLLKEHGQIGLIIVDYLQLMRVPGYRPDNRTAEISEISRSLKALAKEVKAPVLALSQLNRGVEQRTDKRPVMSDLRESGAIEQDADLIAFIYRDEVYNSETRDKGLAEIIIAKQRNGPIGKVKLTFRGQYTRFDNLAYTEYKEIAEAAI